MSYASIPPKAWLAMITVYLVWGTTLGAMHIGVETIPTALLPCARFTLAGVLLLGYCLLSGEKLPAYRDILTHAIIGALLFACSNATAAWTIQHITTGLGGLLVATTPFWMVGLASRIHPREKVTPQAIAGIVIGFLGMIILLLPQLSHINGTSPLFWASILVSVVSTFIWAFGSIYARKKATPNVSLLMGLGLQSFVAGVMLIPVCLLTIHNWHAVQPSLASLLALAYLVVMGTIVATSSYLYTLKVLPVSISSTFAYVTPVITVLFGWLFLGEPLGMTTIIGSAVILAGVMVVQWFGNVRPTSLPKPQPVMILKEEAVSCTSR